MYVYQKPERYLSASAANAELHEAFDCGFLTAMRVFGHVVPVVGNAGEVSRWIAMMVAAYEAETKKAMRTQACKILDAYGYDRAQLWGMLFDACWVDESGYEKPSPLDEPGEDVHHPWPSFYYVDGDGRFVTSRDVHPACVPDGCRKIRCLNLTSYEDSTVYRVTSDDDVMIEELLRRDIMMGSSVNMRYARESVSGGMLEKYAGVIEAALKRVAVEAASEGDRVDLVKTENGQ